MVLTLLDAELAVYNPGADDPEVDDPATVMTERDMSNLEDTRFDITRRIQAGKDTAQFSFDNSQGVYTDVLTGGEKVIFEAKHDTTSQTTDARYGDARHGEATYGGGLDVPITRRWVGYAHPPTYTHFGQGHTGATFDASDYVYEVMASRLAYTAYDDRQIAGTEDSIVNELLSTNAPELDTSLVETVEQTTSVEFNGVDLLEAITELAEIADAVFYSEGESLVFAPLETIRPVFNLDYEDTYLAELEADDRDLINDVRVDGATGYALDQVTAQDASDIASYQEVTSEDPVFFELDPEKPKLDRISVWIRRNEDADDFRVRIQGPNDDNTGPTDPGNEEKDIVSDTSSQEFLNLDGYRDGFRMADETLPSNPWLIIESAGDVGHEIGMNQAGEPAIKTFYPYPIFVRHTDEESIAEYRRRQHRRKKDSISTFQEADDVARAILRHNNRPNRTLEFEAHSPAAHELSPGDAITVNMPELSAVSGRIAPELDDWETELFSVDDFERTTLAHYTGTTTYATLSDTRATSGDVSLRLGHTGTGNGDAAMFSQSNDTLPIYPETGDTLIWDTWLTSDGADPDADATDRAMVMLFGGPNADNCYALEIGPDGVWLTIREDGDPTGLAWWSISSDVHLDRWAHHELRWEQDSDTDPVELIYRMSTPSGDTILDKTVNDTAQTYVSGGLGFIMREATNAWVDAIRLKRRYKTSSRTANPSDYLIVERSDEYDAVTNKLHTTYTAREFASI